MEIINESFTASRVEGQLQNAYQFDLFKANSNRWLWLHKDEALVRIS
jgi:hypothetical protein